MPRRFVPFGSHWAMGIEVPYSLGVVDGGQFWSCGQCPLDLQAEVVAPGDLPTQLRIVADLIRQQFEPHGIAAPSIAKLVAYVAGDADELAESERILKNAMAPVPLVIAVGVPPFYYPGMRVEIDVYGAEQPTMSVATRAVRSGDLIHVVCPVDEIDGCMSAAGVMGERLVTARLYGVEAGKTPALPPDVAIDSGTLFHTTGKVAMADLVFAATDGTPADQAIVEGRDFVVLTRRSAGRYLGLLGRSRQAGQSLAQAAQSIMEAFGRELDGEGLTFADVVKQQTHYVGGANADDLYANMRIRNSYYRSPGPASTGLAVSGFSDPDTQITIEVIACRR